MVITGMLLALAAAGLSVALAAVTLWSGWLALRDELLPGFRTVPPRPRSILLTGIAVLLPICAIALFTLYLAVVLVQRVVSAW